MMLDSEGRWFRSQGQTLWLSVAEEQKVWGHYIPFSPNRLRCSSPGPACLLLKSAFSFSYIGESFTEGRAGLFTPTLLYGRPDFYFFFHMVQNPLLLSSFSLFLAPFISMCFGMKHFCFNLNSSFPFLASYSLQPQRSHGKLSHSFLTSVFLEKASRVPCFLV